MTRIRAGYTLGFGLKLGLKLRLGLGLYVDYYVHSSAVNDPLFSSENILVDRRRLGYRIGVNQVVLFFRHTYMCMMVETDELKLVVVVGSCLC